MPHKQSAFRCINIERDSELIHSSFLDFQCRKNSRNHFIIAGDYCESFRREFTALMIGHTVLELRSFRLFRLFRFVRSWFGRIYRDVEHTSALVGGLVHVLDFHSDLEVSPRFFGHSLNDP